MSGLWRADYLMPMAEIFVLPGVIGPTAASGEPSLIFFIPKAIGNAPVILHRPKINIQVAAPAVCPGWIFRSSCNGLPIHLETSFHFRCAASGVSSRGPRARHLLQTTCQLVPLRKPRLCGFSFALGQPQNTHNPLFSNFDEFFPAGFQMPEVARFCDHDVFATDVTGIGMPRGNATFSAT